MRERKRAGITAWNTISAASLASQPYFSLFPVGGDPPEIKKNTAGSLDYFAASADCSNYSRTIFSRAEQMAAKQFVAAKSCKSRVHALLTGPPGKPVHEKTF